MWGTVAAMIKFAPLETTGSLIIRRAQFAMAEQRQIQQEAALNKTDQPEKPGYIVFGEKEI